MTVTAACKRKKLHDNSHEGLTSIYLSIFLGRPRQLRRWPGISVLLCIWLVWADGTCGVSVSALNHVSFQIRQSDLDRVSPQQHRQLNQLEALMTDFTQTAGQFKPLHVKATEPRHAFLNKPDAGFVAFSADWNERSWGDARVTQGHFEKRVEINT